MPRALSLAALGCAAAFAAVLGVFGAPDASVVSRAAMIGLAVSCVLSFVLIALWPWISPSNEKSSMAFLLSHAPLVLLGLAAALALSTGRKAELSLMAGESVRLSRLYALLGLEGGGETTLRLEAFEKSADGKRKSIAYRSRLRVSRGGKESSAVLEPNKPLRIGKIGLYQKSWSVGVREIRIRFQGRDSAFARALEMGTEAGGRFLMEAIGISAGLGYRWRLEDSGGLVLLEGLGPREFAESELSDYGFSVLSEDYAPLSVLELRRKPLDYLAAIASIIFLIAMATRFWLLPRIPRFDSGQAPR